VRARGWTGGGEVKGVSGGIGITATVVAILARQQGSMVTGRRRRAARQQGGCDSAVAALAVIAQRQ